MFSGQDPWQDANRGYQISPDDLQTLVQLAGKYGPINLMFFIRSIGETCAFCHLPAQSNGIIVSTTRETESVS